MLLGENTTYFVKASVTVKLIFTLTGFDSTKQVNLSFQLNKAAEYKPVKQEVNSTVKLSLKK